MTSTAIRHFEGLGPVPAIARVRLEVSRGSFVKRRPDGTVDFVAPLPCPYNYGSILGTRSDDGDPLDALVIGSRCATGLELNVPVQAAIGFLDAGVWDPKIVCSVGPLTNAERWRVERFFHHYARFKRLLARFRGKTGATEVQGWLKS